ncbi:MAG: T9SS type A sorting domain-containing protein [Bacteroidales bacterium]
MKNYNSNMASEFLNQIPFDYNLTSSQLIEHNAYLEYFTDLSDYLSNDSTDFILDLDLIESLNFIMGTSQGLPGTYARNLLIQERELVYDEPIFLSQTPQSRRKKNETTVYPNAKSLLLYPNPAKDYVIAEIHVSSPSKNTFLTISDFQGRIVQTIPVPNQDDQIVINLKTYSQGLFIVALHCEIIISRSLFYLVN